MNGNNGGKTPMDQRRMAGYGSGIAGVSRKPPHTSLVDTPQTPPTMQQGMKNASPSHPLPPQMNIGKMPTTPRFSNDFGSIYNSPTYNTMVPAPMQVGPMGTTENQKPTIGNRLQNGFSKTKKLRPLLIFSTIAGVTYLGLRTLSGRRSASRDDPEDREPYEGGPY